MKKVLAMLMALGILFSLCACGVSDDTHNTENTSTTVSDTTESVTTGGTTEETTETTTETTHTHTFSDATCTAPKTCSSCGATEGTANGHSWKAATCSTPKTCTVCGATDGSATGHSYTEGTCTKCGSADPNYSEVTYVLNISSKKFHYTSCRRLPTDNRQDTTMSREEIIAQGYSPCGLCNP